MKKLGKKIDKYLNNTLEAYCNCGTCACSKYCAGDCIGGNPFSTGAQDYGYDFLYDTRDYQFWL